MSLKRASLSLFNEADCVFSHRVRQIIAEKDIDIDIEFLEPGHWPEEVAASNPAGYGPTLFERDLVLHDPLVMLEYLDERFPHPSLMPVDPAQRAHYRQMLRRFENDWYSLLPALISDKRTQRAQTRKMLIEDLTVLSPLFVQQDFFMGESFSLIDCSLAALLWRLPTLGIKLPTQAQAVQVYADKLFARPAFQRSLTENERALRTS